MFRPELKLVHEDGRGEMYVITLPGDKELVLLHSVKGSLRGGHAHDVDERIMLLIGEMYYQKQEYSGVLEGDHWSSNTGIKEGETSFNGKGVFHIGRFLEDSWLLEWKINTDKNSWHNIDDPEWRKEVMDNVVGVTG